MSGGEERRRLAVIMFTDIVGYSSLAQRDERLSLDLLSEHNALLRPLFTAAGGDEIKTIGDAFLVEFGSPVEAVRCAIAIQRALNERNTRSRPRLDVRIGLHLGDIVHTPDDVLGDGVNIAARIQPLAVPGGICLSQQVLDQVRDKIEYPLQRMPRVHLKHIESDIRLYQVRLPWLAGQTSLVERLYDGMRFRLGRLRVVVTLVAMLTLAVVMADLVRQGQPGESTLPSMSGPPPPDVVLPAPTPTATPPVMVDKPPVSAPAKSVQPSPGRSPAVKPPTEPAKGGDLLGKRSGGGGMPLPPRPRCAEHLASAGDLVGSCAGAEPGFFWRRTSNRLAGWGQAGIAWNLTTLAPACGAATVGTRAFTARGPVNASEAQAEAGWAASVVIARPVPSGAALPADQCPPGRCGIFAVVCSRIPD